MVYKITNVFQMIGAGIQNTHLINAIGNPLFPLIAISLMFIIILALITYKSKSSWKLFSVAAIITLSATAGILFLNRYMAKKGKTSSSFTGGNTVKLPDSSFFTDNSSVQAHIGGETNEFPAASFDDIFANI